MRKHNKENPIEITVPNAAPEIPICGKGKMYHNIPNLLNPGTIDDEK